MIKIRTTGNFTHNLPRSFILTGVPFIVILSYGFLAFQPDFRSSLPVLIAATAIITMSLSLLLYAGENLAQSPSPRTILIIAILLRAVFLFRSSQLSDDIYRYLWDGMTLLKGGNPYSLAPSDVMPLGGESAGLLKLVNHPRLITIYPPASQIVFAAGAFLGGILGIKSVLVAMDIATCALILRILSRQGLPASRAALYAWNPLPVIEIAASGHIDGAAIFFLMLTFILLNSLPEESASPFLKITAVSALAGLAFSFALLIKLFPLVFLPVFLLSIHGKGRLTFLLGCIAGVAALSFPFLPQMQNMFVTLGIYMRDWEFAGFAFRTLRKIAFPGHTARIILAGLFALSAAFCYAAFFRRTISLNPRGNSLFQATMKTLYLIALAFLLLTPTLHPWYALYLACFLPFHPGAAGMVLAWSVFLSYRVLIPFTLLGKWAEDDFVPAMIWVAAIAALFVPRFVRIFQNRRGSASTKGLQTARPRNFPEAP